MGNLDYECYFGRIRLRQFNRLLLWIVTVALCGMLCRSYAQSSPVAVSILSLNSGVSTVQPGQTVTFTATLRANQTVSGYPVEFSWVGPSGSGANIVTFANYTANQAVSETASWTVPSNAPPGNYKLYVDAYDPSWDVPALSASTASFAVAGATPTAPLAVTLNTLIATPATAQPGQTVVVTATLTANQNASGYPLEFSIIPPGSSAGLNSVVAANYKAGQKIIATASWTVPAATPPGAFKVALGAYDPSWDVPGLATGSTSFLVMNAPSAQSPGPNASFFAKPFYSCLRSFYVSTAGNDSNQGTASSPWLTIQHADSSSRAPGDCVIVAPGTYQARVLIQHGGNAPTPTGYVVYRCATPRWLSCPCPGRRSFVGLRGQRQFCCRRRI